MNMEGHCKGGGGLDAGGGLKGGGGRGLSGEGVHGAQELVCDASRLSQAAEQGTMHRGWVIPDSVLPSEEQTRDRLRKGEGERKKGKKSHQNDKLIIPNINLSVPVN